MQIWSALILVEWTAPDSGPALSAQHDAVAGDNAVDRMRLLERLEVEAPMATYLGSSADHAECGSGCREQVGR